MLLWVVKHYDDCTTGGKNTAVGTQALQTATTVSNQTAIGYQALKLKHNRWRECCCWSYIALKDNTTGDR